MIKMILGFAVVLLIFTSCIKSTNKLPDSTHEGKNIIAWKLDGKVHISEGGEYFAGNHSYYSLYRDSTLEIHGEAKESNLEITLKCLYLGLNIPLKLGDKSLYFGGIRELLISAGNTFPTGANDYLTNDTHTGTLTITYYDSTIIAGTFQMDVVNDAGVVRHITEGRFDISR